MTPVALALFSGGYRLTPVVVAPWAGVRQALVINPDDEGVSQTDLRGRLIIGERISVDLALPTVVVWDGDGSSRVGPGTAVAGLRYWSDKGDLRSATGIELGVAPLGPNLRAVGWGSVARETQALASALLVYEAATRDRAPLLLRFAFGLQVDAALQPRAAEPLGAFVLPEALGGDQVFYAAELVVSRAVPLHDRLGVVIEGDVAIDRVPLSLRALVRGAPAPNTQLDLGLQIPVVEYVGGARSAQLLAQFNVGL